MLFHSKTVSVPSQGKPESFNCHDYSNVIDVDVYKGGYDNQYCKVFYTTPGDASFNEDKKVSLIFISEYFFIDSGKNYSNNPFDRAPDKIVAEDGFRFFKSVKVGSNNVPSRLLIFIKEELSVSESRDTKIEEIVES